MNNVHCCWRPWRPTYDVLHKLSSFSGRLLAERLRSTDYRHAAVLLHGAGCHERLLVCCITPPLIYGPTHERRCFRQAPHWAARSQQLQRAVRVRRRAVCVQAVHLKALIFDCDGGCSSPRRTIKLKSTRQSGGTRMGHVEGASPQPHFARPQTACMPLWTSSIAQQRTSPRNVMLQPICMLSTLRLLHWPCAKNVRPLCAKPITRHQ